MSWKKSLLVICKIIGLFVTTLTADDKCSFLNSDNLMQPIQMQLSKKQKSFSELFSAFLKPRLTFRYFEKNMTLTAYTFAKSQTAKDVVR